MPCHDCRPTRAQGLARRCRVSGCRHVDARGAGPATAAPGGADPGRTDPGAAGPDPGRAVPADEDLDRAPDVHGRSVARDAADPRRDRPPAGDSAAASGCRARRAIATAGAPRTASSSTTRTPTSSSPDSQFRDVAVRFKGNGTYLNARGTEKVPFKVDLNKYVKGQKLAGVETLNFHNNITDPGWMNEVLAYRLYRDARRARAAVVVRAPVRHGGRHDRTPLPRALHAGRERRRELLPGARRIGGSARC